MVLNSIYSWMRPAALLLAIGPDGDGLFYARD